MRPSKIGVVRWQACGPERIAGARHAQQRAGHRIADAVAMRFGHRHALRIVRQLAADGEFLHVARGERHADFFGLLVGGDAGGEGRRHRIAADHVAARGAAALAAGEHPQQARGRAARRGGELVLGDVDHPGALADRHAAERHRIAGIEPALRHAPDRRPPRMPAVAATPTADRRAVQEHDFDSPRTRRHPLCRAGTARSRHCRRRMAAYPRSRSGMRRFYDREPAGARLAALSASLTVRGPRHYTSAVHYNAISGARLSDAPHQFKGNAMSRRCDLTGKGVLVGHKVSHSNIKTKRRFLPNLLNVTLMSDTLGRSVRLRVSANALKTVDHRGGLDAYPAQGQGRRAGAQGARPQAADPEEAGRGGLTVAS